MATASTILSAIPLKGTSLTRCCDTITRAFLIVEIATEKYLSALRAFLFGLVPIDSLKTLATNVRPCLATKNAVYSRLLYAKYSCYLMSRSLPRLINPTNVYNVLFGKFGVGVISPSCVDRETLSSTSFINHISHIILMSTKKEVFRVYAFRIIARMQNMKTVIKDSIMESVRNSAGYAVYSIDLNSPITMSFVSSPFPTTSFSTDIFPKPMFKAIFHNSIV